MIATAPEQNLSADSSPEPPTSRAHQRRQPKRAWRWASVGALLSLASPLGLWIFLEVVAPANDPPLVWAYLYCASGTTLAFTLFGLITGRLMDRLAETAITDPLTGLYNRRHLLEEMTRLHEWRRRQNSSLTVFFIDLDHFKKVNDAHGHSVGDQTLRAVAETIKSSARKIDVTARYGGEEFLLVCLDLKREGAAALGERLRQAIAKLDAAKLGHPGPQTVSIGWTLGAGDPAASGCWTELLNQADQALYRAKSLGRNRVEEFSPRWAAEDDGESSFSSSKSSLLASDAKRKTRLAEERIREACVF